MTMQIRDIVLYSRAGAIRRLPLRLGALNIVTGSSGTGKSALINIVDYCLARTSCPVPAMVIRDAVQWYGLRLQMDRGQVFVARAVPTPPKTTSFEIYYEVGEEIEIPPMERLHGMTNPDSLNEYLTRMLGVSPNLHTPPEGQSRDSLEATLRQAKFLLFQYQDEIAKKDFLFHRQGEEGIARAIRDTLPYFLGAVSEDRLVVRRQLYHARRALKLVERRLADAEGVQGGGSGRAVALVSEAQAVGLLPAGEPPEDVTGMVELLRSVRFTSVADELDRVSESLRRVRQERQQLQKEHRQLQRQIEEAEAYAAGGEAFATEATEQRVRLESIDLFDEPGSGVPRCPLCKGEVGAQLPQPTQLREALARLGQHLEVVGRERPNLQQYIDARTTERDRLTERLRTNREALEALTAQDSEARTQYGQDVARAIVVGRIEMFLEGVQVADETSDLRRQVDAARREVEELEGRLREEDTEEALRSALNIISQQVTRWCSELSLEYSRFALRLDLTKLTLLADTPNGPVPMQQMGSGENWLWCHLLVYLALHQWFVQRNRPVPRFLFIDQPTQVYYPSERDAEGRLEVLADTDREGVRRLFAWLDERVRELDGALQIIVTDHAEVDEPWFQEAVVEHWRNGVALVPRSWMG